jgi:ABC-type nitrate/sulfonate/bicarbonate transport system ATPase subunit
MRSADQARRVDAGPEQGWQDLSKRRAGAGAILRPNQVAIIGGSGCGKSTLLRALAGLDPATSGTVTLDGTAIAAPHPKIGIIFQEPRLLPWLSVADNIGFGLFELPADVRRARVARAPFSALDAFSRGDLQDHLLDLWADTRPTLILVTHDVEEAVVLADRVLVMRPRRRGACLRPSRSIWGGRATAIRGCLTISSAMC